MNKVLIIAFSLSVSFCAPSLKIASGIEDGTYNQMANSLADETDLNVKVIQSTGSGENLKLLKDRKVDLAFCQLDILQNSIFADPELALSVFIIEELYQEEIHLLQNKQSRLQWPLLKPVTLSAGAASSGTSATALIILGYGDADLKKVNLLDTPANQALQQLEKGEIQGVFLVGGTPLPILTSAFQNIDLFEFPEALIQRLQSQTFFYRKSKIGADQYPWLDKDISTLSISSVLLAHKDLPDETVENIVNEIHSKKAILTTAHPKWAELNLEGIDDITFQLQDFVHPFRR